MGQDSTIVAVPIHGDKSSYQTRRNYYRYHLVMPSVPRETLSMQERVGGDNNRTPVKYQGPDIFVFIGSINGYLLTDN